VDTHGFAPDKLRAFPTLLNVFVFRIVARDTSGDFRIGHAGLWAPRPIHWHALSAERDPLIDKAVTSEKGRIYAWFSDGFMRPTVEPAPNGTIVHLSDLRYGSVQEPTRSLWGAEALFDAQGTLTSVNLGDREGRMDIPGELQALWGLFVGEPEDRGTEASPSP